MYGRTPFYRKWKKQHDFENLKKKDIYLSTVAPLVRAQKLRGVALKRRHGNIIFTKMNLLQIFLTIYDW